MPRIVVHYFPWKSLGESVRLLLAYGGEVFEDKRISAENWPAYKPKTPFGQMPVMTINGKQYAQTFAIARYLGRKYGLAGVDIEEDFEIDQNVGYLDDIWDKAIIVHHERDEAYKARKHENFSKNVYPAMLNKLDSMLKASNGHLACGKLTWGDFVFAGAYDITKHMMQNPDLDSQYPSFKKLEQTVYSLPKVKAWAKTAPKSAY